MRFCNYPVLMKMHIFVQLDLPTWSLENEMVKKMFFVIYHANDHNVSFEQTLKMKIDLLVSSRYGIRKKLCSKLKMIIYGSISHE